MATVPADHLDPATPSEVVVALRSPRPELDPTLGERLPTIPPTDADPQPPPRHRLVCVGDSLTHGLSSGAVFRTDLAYPALLAREMGVAEFLHPSYGGPLDGLPLNLEALLDRLRSRLGDDLGVIDRVKLIPTLVDLLDANEDHWERGAGRDGADGTVRHHNLGVYGWDLRDALSATPADLRRRMTDKPDDELFTFKPDQDNDLAGRTVLAAFGDQATQLDAAAAMGADGGIDVLVVVLGANNALDAVVSKRVCWSGPGFDDLAGKSAGGYNVWNPAHFEAEYRQLVSRLMAVDARHVVLGTVPHVTIAPMARGVNPDDPGQKWRPGSRYFPFYVDPWIDDRDFDPRKHRHLTHQQARAIDSAVDQYNETIKATVRQARRSGRNWLLFDLAGLLDGMARRRFGDDPAAAEANDWEERPLPPPLDEKEPLLDTQFFASDRSGRLKGGLFSLDGIHPTTVGYGIVAQELVRVLEAGGIELRDAAGNPRPAPVQIDFAALWAADTLNSSPPPLLSTLFSMVEPLARRFVSKPKPARCGPPT
jgi:lysophospholipase L1-like esterase